MHSTRLLLPLCLLAGALHTGVAEAYDTFSVSVTGEATYAHRQVTPTGSGDVVDDVTTTFAFATRLNNLIIDGQRVLGGENGTTEITAVAGTAAHSDQWGAGSCRATSAAAGDGGITPGEIGDLNGGIFLDVRTLEDADVNFSSCTGNATPHSVDIDPVDSEPGHSPFDASVNPTRAQLKSAGFTLPFAEGNTTAACPDDHTGHTVACSVAVHGTAVFRRLTVQAADGSTVDALPYYDVPVYQEPPTVPAPPAVPVAPAAPPARPVGGRPCAPVAALRAPRTVQVDVHGCGAGAATVALAGGTVLLRRSFAAGSDRISLRLPATAARRARRAGRLRVTVAAAHGGGRFALSARAIR